MNYFGCGELHWFLRRGVRLLTIGLYSSFCYSAMLSDYGDIRLICIRRSSAYLQCSWCLPESREGKLPHSRLQPRVCRLLEILFRRTLWLRRCTLVKDVYVYRLHSAIWSLSIMRFVVCIFRPWYRFRKKLLCHHLNEHPILLQGKYILGYKLHKSCICDTCVLHNVSIYGTTLRVDACKYFSDLNHIQDMFLSCMICTSFLNPLEVTFPTWCTFMRI